MKNLTRPPESCLDLLVHLLFDSVDVMRNPTPTLNNVRFMLFETGNIHVYMHVCALKIEVYVHYVCL